MAKEKGRIKKRVAGKKGKEKTKRWLISPWRNSRHGRKNV